MDTSILNDLLQDDANDSPSIPQAMRDASDEEETPNKSTPPSKSGTVEMPKEGRAGDEVRAGERSGEIGDSGESSDEGTAGGAEEISDGAEDKKSSGWVYDDEMKYKGRIQDRSTSTEALRNQDPPNWQASHQQPSTHQLLSYSQVQTSIHT